MVITASQNGEQVRQAATELVLQPIKAHSMRALTIRSPLPHES